MMTLAQQRAAQQQTAIIKQVQGTSTDASGQPVVVPQVVQLVADLSAAKATILDLGGRLLTAQQLLAGMAQLVHTIVGGDVVAQSLMQLYQLIQANAASDQVTAADLLSRLGQVDAKATANAAALLLTAKASDLAATNAVVAGKVDTATYASGLAGKADAAALAGTTSTVAALSSAVTNATTGLAATYTLAGAAKSTAEATASTVGNASTGLAATYTLAANALPLAGGAMKTGAVVTGLGVPKAAAMDKAVQKSELTGGLQQPYRFFLDVGATPVAAFSRTGERVDVADDNGTGQVLVLTAFVLTNTGTTQLACTVTLTAKTAAGATVYTLTIPVLLSSAPGVGKALDLLALLSTPPATLPLTEPLYFYVSADAGKFTARLEGKKR